MLLFDIDPKRPESLQRQLREQIANAILDDGTTKVFLTEKEEEEVMNEIRENRKNRKG